MRGHIPKQGVSRTRQVPGVEVTGQSSFLQYDRAVGDPLQVGQALGYVEDGHTLCALAVDQAKLAFGVGFRQGRGGFVGLLVHGHNADSACRQGLAKALALPIDPRFTGIRCQGAAEDCYARIKCVAS